MRTFRQCLRKTTLRKFWGSSENSEHDDPQKILIPRKFWGWESSKKKWGSPEYSEDDDPQKILRMRILRKSWGWGSSENSEDPQKILSMTILRKFWGSSKSLRMRILKKIWQFLRKIWRFLRKKLRSLQIFLITIKKFWYIYNENMLIKDQLLLQHISYKVRGYFVLKKHCQYFQRKSRQFSVDITSVSS